jgi:ABC-type sulfate transport system substrate-binding protein
VYKNLEKAGFIAYERDSWLADLFDLVEQATVQQPLHSKFIIAQARTLLHNARREFFIFPGQLCRDAVPNISDTWNDIFRGVFGKILLVGE